MKIENIYMWSKCFLDVLHDPLFSFCLGLLVNWHL